MRAGSNRRCRGAAAPTDELVQRRNQQDDGGEHTQNLESRFHGLNLPSELGSCERAQIIMRTRPYVTVQRVSLLTQTLDFDLAPDFDEIGRGKIKQVGCSDRVAEKESEQWQAPPWQCLPRLAVDYFVARSEVNNLLEIEMAGELFCLAQCGGQIGYLNKAIADGQAPEAIKHLDHLETISKTYAGYILEANREGDQSPL